MDQLDVGCVEGAPAERHLPARARLTLRFLIDFLRAALALGLEGEVENGAGEDRPFLEAITQRADADQITLLLERCLEADFQIERNVGTPLVLEALLDAFAQRLAPIGVS